MVEGSMDLRSPDATAPGSGGAAPAGGDRDAAAAAFCINPQFMRRGLG